MKLLFDRRRMTGTGNDKQIRLPKVDRFEQISVPSACKKFFGKPVVRPYYRLMQPFLKFMHTVHGSDSREQNDFQIYEITKRPLFLQFFNGVKSTKECKQ